MDERDKSLIMLLRENARLPVSELARHLNLSRTATKARLERLERTGVIDGYTLRLSQQVEATRVKAMVMIKSPPNKRVKTERELAAFNTLSSLHSISGEFDLIAELETGSVGELDRTIDRIGELDGVVDTLSSVILATKFSR